MQRHRTFGALLFAVALAGPPAPAQTTTPAATFKLVDGEDWQASSVRQKRAYLIGISNAISVGARYDTKNAAGADTFTLRAQRGFKGASLDTAVGTLDAWYKQHPTEIAKPVISVIWAELAKPQLNQQAGQQVGQQAAKPQGSTP